MSDAFAALVAAAVIFTGAFFMAWITDGVIGDILVRVLDPGGVDD
jgi:hypothetical protein